MEYWDNSNKILIENQEKLRKSVIVQYIKYRKKNNMTQEDVAELMGVRRPNISRFESGQYNPTLDMLIRMAHCLGAELEITLKEKEEIRKGDKEHEKEQ